MGSSPLLVLCHWLSSLLPVSSSLIGGILGLVGRRAPPLFGELQMRLREFCEEGSTILGRTTEPVVPGRDRTDPARLDMIDASLCMLIVDMAVADLWWRKASSS